MEELGRETYPVDIAMRRSFGMVWGPRCFSSGPLSDDSPPVTAGVVVGSGACFSRLRFIGSDGFRKPLPVSADAMAVVYMAMRGPSQREKQPWTSSGSGDVSYMSILGRTWSVGAWRRCQKCPLMLLLNCQTLHNYDRVTNTG